jgi:transcriptional regulator with XRE-family HTH domain
MIIGEKISRLRKERGWSRQNLAKQLGSSGPVIGRYKRGEMVPSVEVARKPADTFGVTLDYLVDTTGTMCEIKNKSMLTRLVEIEQMESEDKQTIIKVVDSLLRDARAKQAYMTA